MTVWKPYPREDIVWVNVDDPNVTVQGALQDALAAISKSGGRLSITRVTISLRDLGRPTKQAHESSNAPTEAEIREIEAWKRMADFCVAYVDVKSANKAATISGVPVSRASDMLRKCYRRMCHPGYRSILLRSYIFERGKHPDDFMLSVPKSIGSYNPRDYAEVNDKARAQVGKPWFRGPKPKFSYGDNVYYSDETGERRYGVVHSSRDGFVFLRSFDLHCDIEIEERQVFEDPRTVAGGGHRHVAAAEKGLTRDGQVIGPFKKFAISAGRYRDLNFNGLGWSSSGYFVEQSRFDEERIEHANDIVEVIPEGGQ